jgi:hypothetical protein
MGILIVWNFGWVLKWDYVMGELSFVQIDKNYPFNGKSEKE